MLVARSTRATGAQIMRSFLLGVMVFMIRAKVLSPTIAQLATWLSSGESSLGKIPSWAR